MEWGGDDSSSQRGFMDYGVGVGMMVVGINEASSSIFAIWVEFIFGIDFDEGWIKF